MRHNNSGQGDLYSLWLVLTDSSLAPDFGVWRLRLLILGINETKIEKNLSLWFALAEIWRAVMLIDEADVYLETQNNRDLQRSSLVSCKSSRYLKELIKPSLMLHSISKGEGILPRNPVPYHQPHWPYWWCHHESRPPCRSIQATKYQGQIENLESVCREIIPGPRKSLHRITSHWLRSRILRRSKPWMKWTGNS